MLNLNEAILGLTSDAPTTVEKPVLVKKFARELGWSPSYYLNAKGKKTFANIHLVVEHGLENSAVLTFLNTPYLSLSNDDRRELLNISYNNMVDWHIHIEKNRVTYIYNRYNPLNNIIAEQGFTSDQYDQLRSESFEKIIGKRPSPNIPSLDDALMNTISHWKRIVSSELNNEVDNHSISGLFNSIIFVRAIEDYTRKFRGFDGEKVLLSSWEKCKEESACYSSILKSALNILEQSNVPKYLIDYEVLQKFDNLNYQTISYLLNDFYQNRQNSIYQYDFSIMSNHALSRIYERYVALLRVEETDQLALFGGNIPVEEVNKTYGAVYTPQYIARFFAKYLQENLSPSKFKDLKVLEPSVGSGIFLRSLLEIQCDPRNENLSQDSIEQAFQNITAIDIDQNACNATQLSLSLLHLILLGNFPRRLNIIQAETISYIQNNDLNEEFDVVISNPPFISSNFQSDEMRESIKSYLGNHAYGRSDSSLAFLKVGIDLLKPGGTGLFVIPHSFLIADSAKKLRQLLAEECNIICLADLSSIPVFSNVGIYVILLIFQKKQNVTNIEHNATIIKARDFVGRALESALMNERVDNDFFSVYEVSNSVFNQETWNILPYRENIILEKFSKLPTLGEFANIKQGFVSGNDEVFILNGLQVPKDESEIYVPYLTDRNIDRFHLPKKSSKFFFFPFVDGRKITQEELESRFPKTWQYLLKNREKLKNKDEFDWWRPHRTRQPQDMIRPKIVSPHLVLSPKFCVDTDGKYAVSHSPYVTSKVSSVQEKDFLLYLSAVLNSTACFWYISNHSHKYNNGYAMLEVKTLKKTRIPNPNTVPPQKMQKLLRLVTQRMNLVGYEGYPVEREIDHLVADLYLLNDDDKITLGLKDD
ncbi:MAG: N-6 DNA methylase [Bacteroidota bacterium]